MDVDIDILRESPREHQRCRACGRVVGRLPLHIYKIHGWTIEQYYREYPEARKIDPTPTTDTGPLSKEESPTNQQLLGYSWGKDLIETSLNTKLEKEEHMRVIRIGHRTRRNFNKLVGGIQFSFGPDGIATVSISYASQLNMLLMQPGFYLPQEKAVAAPVVESSPVEKVKEEVVVEKEAEPEEEDTHESKKVIADEPEEEVAMEEKTVAAEEKEEEDDDASDYDDRKAELKVLKYFALQKEAKRVGVESTGKAVEIIERILDDEFEDAEE